MLLAREPWRGRSDSSSLVVTVALDPYVPHRIPKVAAFGERAGSMPVWRNRVGTGQVWTVGSVSTWMDR